jgi:hypothetical protein
VTNDTTTNATYYPTLSSATSGTFAPVVSGSRLTFNPSTGFFQANTLSGNTYTGGATSPAISSGTLTLDLNLSNLFYVSLNGNITTLTINNTQSSGAVSSFALVFIADGTARTVAWPASFKWPSATAPTITSTNGKRDVFVFFTYDGETNWHSFISGQNL